ncbi:ROK family protein [Candidatus Contubernalis alkaliaceticus]|uniref:ROK family protein n=1 Tax=Candidatus Contubernalis alkaliaceticus TaxID=338645 RepID=UPI001F4BD015|nr:ROK family protein [Candidatus Contubernalis alkalaceticus]UNC93422.1 ROK family protein [Candidatus Contubernalis alkalaceticus]
MTQGSSKAHKKSKPYIIGVDLGGTKTLTVVATTQGEILLRKKEETPASQGPEVVLAQIQEDIRQVIQLQGIHFEEIQAVGMCAAGFYNHREKVMVKSPNLAGWTHIPLPGILEERIGLPVFVENDANAAAYGEFRLGGGRGKSHVVYITVSTGIGGGIIADGEIFHGSQGYAGEIGHFSLDLNGPQCKCGNRGCLEAISSGTAIARQAAEMLAAGRSSRMPEVAAMDGRRDVTARHVFTAAELGDEAAAEIVDRAIKYLGAGLAGMATLLNTEIFVIGGGVSMSGNSFFQPLQKAFFSRAAGPITENVEIVPAVLGDEAGIVGAVLLAAEEYALGEGGLTE